LEVNDAIDYAKFRSRSHHTVIRVYDETGNVIETHEHIGDSVQEAKRLINFEAGSVLVENLPTDLGLCHSIRSMSKRG
jgi:hypothetical protein